MMKARMLRILLADPQPATRRVLSREIGDAGFEVQTTTSGRDVILSCEVDPPDVLIMDVHLPDMDGFEVCEYVRRETRDLDITIIIVTNAVDEVTRSSLKHMVDYVGGDFFFARPFDGQLLVRLLSDLRRDDLPTKTARRSDSPTRMVWPTRRPHSPAAIGCLG